MRILQRERIFENNPGEQFFIPFIIAAVALVVADLETTNSFTPKRYKQAHSPKMPELVPTKAAFDEIINGNAGKLVVVDFTAT